MFAVPCVSRPSRSRSSAWPCGLSRASSLVELEANKGAAKAVAALVVAKEVVAKEVVGLVVAASVVVLLVL